MSSDYEHRLQQRLRVMEAAWQQWLDGDLAGRELLLSNAHQLSGSAALYGYIELGRQAEVLHQALNAEPAFTEARNAWLQLHAHLQAIVMDSSA